MKLITIAYSFLVFGFGMTAVVKISTPNSAVELGSNIKITVSDVSPHLSDRRFDRLDCAIISPHDQMHKKIVAQYDKHLMMFKAPAHGIDGEYRDRISYVGPLSFVIERVRFSDKSLKVMCILSYKNGSLTSHVESTVYKVEAVYVGPAFQISSTKKGTVAVTQGQKAILQCDVKSIPQSNICWQSSIEISAYTVKTEKTEDKGEIITKSSFILDYPVSKHDGKLVLCIVRQKYGAILQRGFTLKYKSGADKPNHAAGLANVFGDYCCCCLLIYIFLHIML